MVSNCADLTISIFLYLTVRSPIWHYNYRLFICTFVAYFIKLFWIWMARLAWLRVDNAVEFPAHTRVATNFLESLDALLFIPTSNDSTHQLSTTVECWTLRCIGARHVANAQILVHTPQGSIQASMGLGSTPICQNAGTLQSCNHAANGLTLTAL